MNAKQEIERIIHEASVKASKLALAEIERRARQILRKHPNLAEYAQGMGTWNFLTRVKHNNYILDHVDDATNLKYLAEFSKFMDRQNELLRITGIPMRFTVDGPVVMDW